MSCVFVCVRTQVSFHPSNPSILVSGSLDHTVCVWDIVSGDKLLSNEFGRWCSGYIPVPVSIHPCVSRCLVSG